MKSIIVHLSRSLIHDELRDKEVILNSGNCVHIPINRFHVFDQICSLNLKTNHRKITETHSSMILYEYL